MPVRVLTFNVFMGSPLPCCCGTRSLPNSTRLRQQLRALTALDADILCLQEVTTSDLVRRYGAALGPSYAPVWKPSVPPLRACVAAELLLLCLTGLLFLVLYGAAINHITQFGAAFLWLTIYVFLWRALAHSVVFQFLLGNVAGSLVLFYRRSVFSLVLYDSMRLESEVGDALNAFRPRCVQFVELRAAAGGARYIITHIHANALGPTAARAAQLAEGTRHALETEDGVTVSLLLGDFKVPPDEAGVRRLAACGLRDTLLRGEGPEAPTWGAANPLTRGILRLRDHRCDYIFLKSTTLPAGTLLGSLVVLNRPPFTSDHYGVLLEVGGTPSPI